MIGFYKLCLYIAEGDHIPEINDMPFDLVLKKMLLELSVNKGHRKPCGINGYIKLFYYIRNSPDMILMSMSDNEAAELFRIFRKIADIRYDQVYTQHVILRKSQSAIDDDY